MSLPSTLLCLIPSTILVAGYDPWGDSYESAANLAVAQNLAPDEKKFKILDFSKDNDHELDSNGEYTCATLNAGPLPESITVCSAFMVEAWQPSFKESRMFYLIEDLRSNNSLYEDLRQAEKGHEWGFVSVYADYNRTEYTAYLGGVTIVKNVPTIFFPKQWTRACLSLDSTAGKVQLVVDGQLLGKEEYKREEDEYRPTTLLMRLGLRTVPLPVREYTGKVANLNVFDVTQTVERMEKMTRAGDEECGALGTIVNWEETEVARDATSRDGKWYLTGEADYLDVDEEDKKWEGPCKRESKVQVFSVRV